jgi:hypothetical protein
MVGRVPDYRNARPLSVEAGGTEAPSGLEPLYEALQASA